MVGDPILRKLPGLIFEARTKAISWVGPGIQPSKAFAQMNSSYHCRPEKAGSCPKREG